MSYPFHQPGHPRQPDLFHLRLVEHIGAVIFWHQRTYTFTGTIEQCEAAYRRAQTQNLAVGWWSLASLLVMNWIALFSNLSAIRKLRALAQQPPEAALPAPSPAGWYHDPSGPGHRYWDGVTWTQWTHPR
ncbi:hypothetical protein MSIMFI_00213 [Mycobacterium simulans]|uniref:DUF2510 domain-containing protein n=1 Tax=Mycobacterium simulans TaxID=627089 RepID=UPI0019BCCE32|nr:DUF2510 domain-containing protein [Mycobacterium simulans]SON58735.1 hypothetical protein MSIMFI_00213 [Mycobacterium simulans]